MVTAGSISVLPEWTQGILSVLGLFAADMNFSQPGCAGISTYADVFGLNIAGMMLSRRDIAIVSSSCA